MQQKRAADRVTLDIIGYVRSCFPTPFGIPRQPGLAPSAVASLELLEPCNRPEMIRGLERCSHIWLQFLFHQAVAEGWKPMVRPPRLGGRRRLGVLATRSPHRPNHLGLSVVRLLNISGAGGRVILELGGVDLLDGTPVLDIKPYVSYSDSLPAATGDFPQQAQPEPEIVFEPEARLFCAGYETSTERKLAALIAEVLRQDPRPAIQRGRRTEFGMLLWDVNVRWVQEEARCRVISCELSRERPPSL